MNRELANAAEPVVPLPRQFSKDGFAFRQLDRDGMVALFAKSRPGSEYTGYEVVIIQCRRAGAFKGKAYPAAEVMPSSEKWGRCGWTYPDRGMANLAFRKMVSNLQDGRSAYNGRPKQGLNRPGRAEMAGKQVSLCP